MCCPAPPLSYRSVCYPLGSARLRLFSGKGNELVDNVTSESYGVTLGQRNRVLDVEAGAAAQS